MAKKKKRSGSRRRRVGAAKDSPLMAIVGAVAGAIGGRILANKFTSLNPKIMAAVQALGGGVLAYKGKSSLLKGLGYGLATNGAISAGQAFGVLSGVIGSPGYTIPFAANRDTMSGFRDVAKIGQGDEVSFPKPNAIGRSVEIGSLIG